MMRTLAVIANTEAPGVILAIVPVDATDDEVRTIMARQGVAYGPEGVEEFRKLLDRTYTRSLSLAGVSAEEVA